MRSLLPRATAHDPTTSTACHSPPASTSKARPPAAAGWSGSALAISSATGHCKETDERRRSERGQQSGRVGPDEDDGDEQQRMAGLGDAPINVETAIPAAASATASTRLRVTPRKETKPAGRAPSAAKLPCLDVAGADPDRPAG